MWYFNETERAKVLQGRTVTYLAKEKLLITPEYLMSILRGYRSCSERLANQITNCISWDSKITDYFKKVEK